MVGSEVGVDRQPGQPPVQVQPGRNVELGERLRQRLTGCAYHPDGAGQLLRIEHAAVWRENNVGDVVGRGYYNLRLKAEGDLLFLVVAAATGGEGQGGQEQAGERPGAEGKGRHRLQYSRRVRRAIWTLPA